MGEAKARQQNARDVAFSRTDRCVYCGGNTVGTTVDHCPARAFFYARRWPEGYVFPSCEACNSGTKDVETWVALLSLMYSDDEKNRHHHAAQFDRLAGSLLSPEIARQMMVSAVQKKGLARQARLRPRPGQAYGDMEIVKVPDEATQAIPNFAEKIAKALHFFHTGRIVPVEAAIEHRAFTNYSFMEGSVPPEIFKLPGGVPTLRRSNVDLGPQFNYLYGVSPDGDMSMFTMWFRKSFCLSVILAFDPAVMDLVEVEPDADAPLAEPTRWPAD